MRRLDINLVIEKFCKDLNLPHDNIIGELEKLPFTRQFEISVMNYIENRGADYDNFRK